MKVSVILPTYNEAGNIVDLIEAIRANIPDGWEHEILVVDDSSPDGTLDKVKATFPDAPDIVTILRTEDRGLARSIRTGVEAATGDQVLVMDTDFTHDPKDIDIMLHVARKCDIVSGSRFVAGGNMQSRLHYVLSLVYNWFVRIVLRTQIQDNLGGYFTMPAEKLRRLPFDRIFFGYGDYYFRLLHHAQADGLSIIEIPCFYRGRTSGESKTPWLRTLIKYTRALFRCVLSRDRSDPRP